MNKLTEAAMDSLVNGKVKVRTCINNQTLLEVQNAFSGVPLDFTITQGDLARLVDGNDNPVPADPTQQNPKTTVVLLAVPTTMETDF